jgi:transcription elongation factor Elf1
MSRTLHTRGAYPSDWKVIASECKSAARWKCIRCGHDNCRESGHVLTVHHFDGDKSNCEWWNLLALCQRCHLRFQGRVNPHKPYMFEHSEWLKPYVAGFYAAKYEGRDITRAEAEARLQELLAYERIDQ